MKVLNSLLLSMGSLTLAIAFHHPQGSNINNKKKTFLQQQQQQQQQRLHLSNNHHNANDDNDAYYSSFDTTTHESLFHDLTKNVNQIPSNNDNDNPSRRRRRFFLLTATTLTTALSTTTLSTTPPALAAPPMTMGEAEGLGAQLDRKLRIKPPKILRSKLSQDFAVLLMRSSYAALDALDCVAMDQFQRDFFILRQAEYQPYTGELGPGVVQQGVLTDPYYFDFISFAQYATIAREIRVEPAAVFEEQQPLENGDDEDAPQTFVPVVIKRDPNLSNDMLAARHSQLVGKAIIDKLEETFEGTTSAIPKVDTDSPTSSSSSLLASLQQLTKLFLINGFAFDGNVVAKEESITTTEYCITLINPATLWSGKALQRRKADPLNCFLLKAATELISRTNGAVVLLSSSVKYDANQEKTYIKVRRSV